MDSLVAMHDRHIQGLAWHQELSSNITGFYRMRGEYPFSEPIRNLYEVLREDYDRLEYRSSEYPTHLRAPYQ